MKKIITTLLLFCIGVTANSQSVTFYNDQVRYDNKPLLMNGTFGSWTNSQYVEFNNQSGNSVSVNAHLHHHLNFIYFVDSENNADHNINITIPSGRKYTLRVIAKLSSGSPIIYNDQLGFDITYQDNRTSYFELNASAYFHNSNGGSTSTSFSKPQDYGFIGYGYKEVNSGKPMRWNKNDFPLRIYSNHTSYGYSNEYTKIIQKALNMWNVTGNSVGISSDVFVLTTNYNNSDIQMDWSGQVLKNTGKQNILGVAIPGQNVIGMWSLQTYKNYFNMGLGAVGETLVQELGHLLGPIHSEVRNDIMNGTSHGHYHDLSQIEITERDRRMLGWIYTRNDYYPFSK